MLCIVEYMEECETIASDPRVCGTPDSPDTLMLTRRRNFTPPLAKLIADFQPCHQPKIGALARQAFATFRGSLSLTSP